jgi:hypothetical protein
MPWDFLIGEVIVLSKKFGNVNAFRVLMRRGGGAGEHRD